MLCIFQFEDFVLVPDKGQGKMIINTADTMTLSLNASLIAPHVGIGHRHQSFLSVGQHLDHFSRSWEPHTPINQHRTDHCWHPLPSLLWSKDMGTWPRACRSDTCLLDFGCKESPPTTESASQTLVSSRITLKSCWDADDWVPSWESLTQEVWDRT